MKMLCIRDNKAVIIDRCPEHFKYMFDYVYDISTPTITCFKKKNQLPDLDESTIMMFILTSPVLY